MLSYELLASGRDCVESVLLDALRRTERRAHGRGAAVAAWARRFTHLLHFFHVAESLRGRVEPVVRILFQEVQRLLVHDGLASERAVGHYLVSRNIVLEGQAKSRLGRGLVDRVWDSVRRPVLYSAFAVLLGLSVVRPVRRVVRPRGHQALVG